MLAGNEKDPPVIVTTSLDPEGAPLFHVEPLNDVVFENNGLQTIIAATTNVCNLFFILLGVLVLNS